MPNWITLLQSISKKIRANNNQEITGPVLQTVLNSIVNNVGENATYAGIITPTSIPSNSEGPIFYFANTPGVYSNFDRLTLEDGLYIVYCKDTSANVKWAATQLIKDTFITTIQGWEALDNISLLGQAVSKGISIYNFALTTTRTSGVLFIFSVYGGQRVMQVLLCDTVLDASGNLQNTYNAELNIIYRVYDISKGTFTKWKSFVGSNSGEAVTELITQADYDTLKNAPSNFELTKTIDSVTIEIPKFVDSGTPGNLELPVLSKTSTSPGLMLATDYKAFKNAISALPETVINTQGLTEADTVTYTATYADIVYTTYVKNRDGIYEQDASESWRLKAATSTKAGLMSAADKTKLDSLSTSGGNTTSGVGLTTEEKAWFDALRLADGLVVSNVYTDDYYSVNDEMYFAIVFDTVRDNGSFSDLVITIPYATNEQNGLVTNIQAGIIERCKTAFFDFETLNGDGVPGFTSEDFLFSFGQLRFQNGTLHEDYNLYTIPIASVERNGLLSASDYRLLNRFKSSFPEYLFTYPDDDLVKYTSTKVNLCFQEYVKNEDDSYAPDAIGIWTIDSATSTKAGLMSAADKVKLDALSAGGSSSTDKMALFIDLWNIAAGSYGTYNSETGFFELNGLTDITYEQALAIYVAGQSWTATLNGQYIKANIRTNLPKRDSNIASGIYNSFLDCPTIEVVNLKNAIINQTHAFNGCSKLREIIGNIYTLNGPASSFSHTVFKGCESLEIIKGVIRTNYDIHFDDCSKLRAASINNLITQAINTSTVNIYLHADAYNRLSPSIINAALNKNINLVSVTPE